MSLRFFVLFCWLSLSPASFAQQEPIDVPSEGQQVREEHDDLLFLPRAWESSKSTDSPFPASIAAPSSLTRRPGIPNIAT